MQNYSKPNHLNQDDNSYISRDDESEARIVNTGNHILTDSDVGAYNFDGFGIDIDRAPVSDHDLSR